MSNFGFYAKGNAGNLIIDEENPVLAVLQSGLITMTEARPYGLIAYGRRRGRDWTRSGPLGWRVCTVTFTSPIQTIDAPLIFAVPSGAGNYGLGGFSFLGVPGNWTGFRVYTTEMDLQNTITSTANAYTGWKWFACSFSAPPSSEIYGMRIWDGQSKLVFDSGWRVVPFRTLLQSWSTFRQVELDTLYKFVGGDYHVDSKVILPYWGNGNANSSKQIDEYWHQFRHSWNRPDNTWGVMISGLCAQPVQADNGYDDNYKFYSVGILGLRGMDRTNLYYTLPIGYQQHIGINPGTVNNFRIMTADFSLLT